MAGMPEEQPAVDPPQYLDRAARKQVPGPVVTERKDQHGPVNIWSGRRSGPRPDRGEPRERRKRDASAFRCVPPLHAGKTRGTLGQINTFCLYFARRVAGRALTAARARTPQGAARRGRRRGACLRRGAPRPRARARRAHARARPRAHARARDRGMCYQGSACTYLHRLPTAADDAAYARATGSDIFGRDKLPERFDGTGRRGDAPAATLQRDMTTLYVHYGGAGAYAVQHLRDLLLTNFGAFGPVRSVYVVPSKTIAFVRFHWRASAEFAKEAMDGQHLEGSTQGEASRAPRGGRPGAPGRAGAAAAAARRARARAERKPRLRRAAQVLDVCWAHEDPNPVAVIGRKRSALDAAEAAALEAWEALPPEEKRARLAMAQQARARKLTEVADSMPQQLLAPPPADGGGNSRQQFDEWRGIPGAELQAGGGEPRQAAAQGAAEQQQQQQQRQPAADAAAHAAAWEAYHAQQTALQQQQQEEQQGPGAWYKGWRQRAHAPGGGGAAAAAGAAAPAAEPAAMRRLLLIAAAAVLLPAAPRARAWITVSSVCPGNVAVGYAFDSITGRDDTPSVFWSEDYDKCNGNVYDFEGDTNNSGWLKGLHGNLYVAYCNAAGHDCQPCGSCGQNWTMYDTILKKTVYGPGGQPSCDNGGKDAHCLSNTGRMDEGCPEPCNDANTSGGCAPCVRTYGLSRSRSAPAGTSPAPAGESACADKDDVLGLAVGEFARLLSQTFCDGGFEGDRTDGGGGFVGFTFAGAILDHIDHNDDGVHSCAEYRKLFADKAFRPGHRLPKPRCRLGARGKRMMTWINTGRKPK
ncbi:cwc2 [Scenedesmus sp. PABB004]|nr:cwc2 [Scenedesmus sp. PABB004]